MGKKTKKGKSRAGRSRSRSFKKNKIPPTGMDQGSSMAKIATPISPASVVHGPEDITVVNDKPMPPTPLTKDIAPTDKGEKLSSHQATKEAVADNEPVNTVEPADEPTKLVTSKEVPVSAPEAITHITESVSEPAIAEVVALITESVSEPVIAEVVEEAVAPEPAAETAEAALEPTKELVNEDANFDKNESSPINESITAADTTAAEAEKDQSDAKHTEETPPAIEQTSAGVTELVEEEAGMVASNVVQEPAAAKETVMEEPPAIVQDETVVMVSKPEKPETQVEKDTNSSAAVTDIPPEAVPETKSESRIAVDIPAGQPKVEYRADDSQSPLKAVGIVPESGEAVKEEPVASDKEPAVVQDKLPVFVVFHEDIPMMDEPMVSEANESQEKCDCSACIIL